MTKNRIPIALGALVLSIVGFLTTNAHTKFRPITTVWFKAGSTFVVLFSGAFTSALTSTVTAGKTAFFKTALAAHTLVVAPFMGVTRVYYK